MVIMRIILPQGGSGVKVNLSRRNLTSMTQEEKNAYQREYRRKNPEKARAYGRERYRLTKEQRKRYNQAYYAANPERRREIQRKYDESEKGRAAKRRSRSRRLLALYGITIERYDAMYEAQEGRCAICCDHHEPYVLRVDHNHVTKQVRGLLCHPCNAAIGFFKERAAAMQAAILYVER